MSVLEPPASLGLMFPFKEERSRNKERLEASLAALCELELLKQRQESRVLGALCLGDNSADAPGRTAWTALGAAAAARFGTDAQGEDAQDYGLRLQTSSLQCTPWGIMASLEQHVAQLKVNAEVKLTDLPTVLEDGQPPAGEVCSPKDDLFPVEASAFHQRFPRSLSAPNGNGDIEPRDNWLSDLTRSTLFADALAELKSLEQGQEGSQQAQKAETYIFGLIQRKALPPRPSKPRTSLAPDARATGVVRQSSLCRKDEQQAPKQVPVQVIPQVPSPAVQSQVPDRVPPLAAHNLDQERYQGMAYLDEPPPPYHHLQQSVQHQPGPYHKPKQVPVVANRSISLEYPSCRVIPTHVDSSNSDPDSPHNFQGYTQALPKPQQLPPPEEHLVNAEYIPAQPCRASTRAYAHHHPHHHSSGKSAGPSKPNRSTYSPERAHQHPEQQPAQSQPSRSRSNAKKSDKNGAARKQGKKACRSQSENSLQRAPERKYSTVERDGAGSGSGSRGSRGSQSKSKKQQQQQHGNGQHRRWQSSLELSQDEAEQPHGQTHAPAHPASNQRDQCSRRARKARPTPHPAYAYPVPNHHNHQHLHHLHSHHHERHVEYQLDTRPVEDYHHAGQGESESSSSEADSPDSSSLSSDSDESGGLVWPQQLPPQLAHPQPAAAAASAAAAAAAAPGAPLQQKAFVKIKASHALKKKILRFRTGSLKVMTTV